MAGRKPHEAVRVYLEPLKQVISCVTRGQLSVSPGGYQVSDTPHSLMLNRANSVELDGPAGISLRIVQDYRIVEAEGDKGPWRVTTTAYEYALSDREDHEIIVYHWHPGGKSPEVTPHLHLKAGAKIGREELVKAHIPTSRVSIEAVIRLTITAFKVDPHRQDWAEVHQRTEEAYEKESSWQGSGPKPQ